MPSAELGADAGRAGEEEPMSENTAPEAATAEDQTVPNPEDTQDEPLGEPGKRALDRERAERKAAQAERDDLAARLKAFEDEQKSDAEKVADRLAAAEKRAADLESRALRAEVASEKGVPAALLHGGTRDELEAEADALIDFKGETKRSPSSPAISRANGGAVKGSTADQFASFVESKLN